MPVIVSGVGFFHLSSSVGSASSSSRLPLAASLAGRVFVASGEGNTAGAGGAAPGKKTALQFPQRKRPPESVSAGGRRGRHNGQSIGLPARGGLGTWGGLG